MSNSLTGEERNIGGGRGTRECLLAGGFVGVYFVPFEIPSIGEAHSAGTPSFSSSSSPPSPLWPTRYLAAKILRRRSRHNGRNKGFDRSVHADH